MVKLYKILNYKHIAKVLTLVFLLFLSKSWGQASLPVSRSSWGSTPTGWTDSGTGNYATSFACSGNDGGQLNSNGDFYQVFYNGPAVSLSFVTKSTLSFTGTFDVQESSNGTSWSTIQSFTSLSTNCITTNLVLNCSSRYVRFYYTLRNQNITLDDVNITAGSCGNTITTGLISTAPFNLANCASTAAGSVAFTSTGTFIGNTYSVQISNASGSFAAPVTIGTLVSNANTGSINFTIPAGTIAGTGYLIRVISSSPSVNGSNSAAFTITSGCAPVCPYITGAFIDGCANGGCPEGNGEAIFVKNGSYPLNCTSNAQATTNVNIMYGSSSSLTQTSDHLTDGYVNNPSVISCLNGLSGCSAGSFIDALGVTIPANSSIMIVSSNFCCGGSTPTDFSGLCAVAPVYVLFSNDGNWLASGTFKNYTSGCLSRYFEFSSGATSPCGNYKSNYKTCSLSNSDGDYVSWSASGGAPIAYANSGCAVPPIILPIELLDFYATQNEDKNDLVWKVASEKNIQKYLIEKSEDGINFLELTRLDSKNLSEGITSYTCQDVTPFNGITYYKLSTIETNGRFNTEKIISIDRNNKSWKPLLYQQNNELIVEFKNNLPKKAQLQLFDLSGKQLVDTSIELLQTKINIDELADGIYFVKIATPYKTENFKVVISN